MTTMHPVLLAAYNQEVMTRKAWLTNPNQDTRSSWDKSTKRFDYLTTLTSSELDSEYPDLAPANDRPFDPEQADMDDQRRPQ